MSASRPTCETCVFWDQYTCRIRSHMPVWSNQSGNVFIWPKRGKDDWCGEHPDFPKTERTAPKLEPDRMPPQPGARLNVPADAIELMDLLEQPPGKISRLPERRVREPRNLP